MTHSNSRRRRILGALLFSAAMFIGVVTAAAATLGGVGVFGLGAESVSVLSCDTDGITVEFDPQLIEGEWWIHEVGIGGLEEECVGQQLEVTVGEIGKILVNGATEVTSTDPHQVELNQPIKLADIVGVAVVVVGT